MGTVVIVPNRIIKESICTSDNLDRLSWFEEVFFYRLIVHCDDYGRMDARLPILRARLFPLKTVTDKQIAGALETLRSVGIVDLYDVDGRPYLQMRTWFRHQRLRQTVPKYPAPDVPAAPDAPAAPSDATACDGMRSDANACAQDRGPLPESAAACGNKRQVAARIQSESESESEDEDDARVRACVGDASSGANNADAPNSLPAALAKRYGLPGGRASLDALTQDIAAYGAEAVEAALAEAARSNSRPKLSVNFYRAVLHRAQSGGLQQHTQQERREAYSAAVVDLDGE